MTIRTRQMIGAALLLPALAAHAGTRSVTDLQPFTHTEYIPATADPATIRFEGVHAVRVKTKRRDGKADQRYCDDRFREPGGSLYCPPVTYEASVQAYEVRYSYRNQPLASDETANDRFIFSVYFRAEELSAGARAAIAADRGKWTAGEYFHLTSTRDIAQTTAIDTEHTTFCPANYIDGAWAHQDRDCEDDVPLRTVPSPSPYFTVRVSLAQR